MTVYKTYNFLSTVSNLPSASNYGGGAVALAPTVALPSISGRGAYLHYWTKFYELTCDEMSCSWSVMPQTAGTTITYNTAMYLPSDYVC